MLFRQVLPTFSHTCATCSTGCRCRCCGEQSGSMASLGSDGCRSLGAKKPDRGPVGGDLDSKPGMAWLEAAVAACATATSVDAAIIACCVVLAG